MTPKVQTTSVSHDHDVMARGVMVNSLGILAKTTRPLFLILFSRTLGSERFGTYMLAFAIQEIISKFAALGLERGLMFQIGFLNSQGRQNEIRSVARPILWAIIGMTVVVAASLGFSASWISETIIHKPELTVPLRIFALGMPFLCMTYTLLFAIRPRMDMRYEVYTQSIFEPFVILSLGATFLFGAGLGLNGIVIAHVIASVATALLAYSYYRKLYPASNVHGPVDWKQAWKNGVPMGAVEFLNQFKNRLDLLVIGKFLPLSVVGVYSAVVEVSSVLRKTRAAFDPIVTPIAQSLHYQGEKKRLSENLGTAVRWIMVPAMALLGAMWLVPEGFLKVFGADFALGAQALRIIAFGQLFIVTLGMMETVLSMTGYAFVTLVNAAVLIAINLVLLVLWVPEYGINGAAAATSVSIIIVAVWRLLQAKKLLGVLPFQRAQMRPLKAFAIAFPISWLFGYWIRTGEMLQDLIVGVLYLKIYFGLVYWLRKRDKAKTIRSAVLPSP